MAPSLPLMRPAACGTEHPAESRASRSRSSLALSLCAIHNLYCQSIRIFDHECPRVAERVRRFEHRDSVATEPIVERVEVGHRERHVIEHLAAGVCERLGMAAA